MKTQQNKVNKKLLGKKQFKIAVVATIILGVLITAFILWGTQPRFLPYTFHGIEPGELTEPTPTISYPSLTPGKNFLSPTSTPKIQTNISASPTPKTVFSPTPSSRTPNPPIINISYPSEMQSIEFTSSSQKLCVVDIPAGGNASGLQRKHNINDGGWSSYSDVFTLCFDPKEGLNRFQVQYHNGFGDESAMYTRQFNFHLINDVMVNISGQLYMDQNCNKTKDPGEPGVPDVNVTMYKGTDGYSSLTVKTAVSDSNGNYTVSDTIKSNESINFRASAYSHSVIEYAPTSFVTLNSTTTSVSQDIGMTQSNGGCR